MDVAGRFRKTGFSLALTVACAAAASASAADPLRGAGFPQSCGVQLKSHNFTVETLDQVHELGFRVVRRGFYWKSIEKEKGVYDFSDYDSQMQHARQLGLTVVGCLFGNNELYEDDGQGGIQTETGREGFSAFAAALAERYKDHDVLWEVWNEPNVRTFWRKDGKHNSDEFAAEYTELVKAVVPAMLKADPDCFVMAGSVSNYWEPSYQWTESCFQKGILGSGIRGWSVHPYGVKTAEEFAVGHGHMRELLKKYGAPDLPILDTERGFAVKETYEGWSGGSKERAREFQAWNLVRQFLVDRMCGVSVTVWYEWDGDEFGIGDDGGSRPAYTACRTMFQQLDGFQFVRRVPSDSDLDYVLLLENQAKERKLVAWTAPPPGGTPEEATDHEVAIEVLKSPSFEVVDIAGGSQKRPLDAVRLALRGAPQYVALPAEIEIGKCASAAPAAEGPATGAPPTQAAVAAPAGTVDLNVFDPGVPWKFLKNTGEGSFTVGSDDNGTPIGVMHYDFTRSKSKSYPYVLAGAPVNVAEGARELRISARSPIRQRLTFRVVDSTGQTHQVKGRITGSGEWETIRIPLNRRLEHWDGANDGTVHFPLKEIVFCVPMPDEDHKSGTVEYAAVVAVPDAETPRPEPAGSPTEPAPPATLPSDPSTEPEKGTTESATGSVPLKLFEAGVPWKFVKNTGRGSFTLDADKDGARIGIMEYDFTKSKSKSWPYVLAKAPVNIPEGAREVRIAARSPIAQQLTFRLVDSTGQTHQFKCRIDGTGQWETVRIPLTRRLEHWGGAADGTIHFPVATIVFSVPLPSEDARTGKVEYSDAVVDRGSP